MYYNYYTKYPKYIISYIRSYITKHVHTITNMIVCIIIKS